MGIRDQRMLILSALLPLIERPQAKARGFNLPNVEPIKNWMASEKRLLVAPVGPPWLFTMSGASSRLGSRGAQKRAFFGR